MSDFRSVGAPVGFTQFCKALQLAGPAGPLGAVRVAEHRNFEPRVVETLKQAAIGTGDLTDLAGFQILSGGFIESLRLASAFDAMLGSMRPMPLRARIGVVTQAAEGAAVAESALKPLTRVTLAGASLAEKKCVATLICSNELLRMFGATAEALFALELKNAVAVSTDLIFFATILDGITPLTSSGSDAAAVHADIGALLAAVPTGATSRLFLVMSADTAKQISTMATTSGATAFPEMTPSGGTLCGLSALVTDGLEPVDSEGSALLVLLDANQIGADGGIARPSTARHATFSLDQVEDATAEMLSLWQTNQMALRVERTFGLLRLRANAVAAVAANYAPALST